MLLRLQKILMQAGISSRRKAEEYIAEGRVSINGRIVKTAGVKADPVRDKICFNGRAIRLEKKVYILLNKPKGYLCTSRDTHGRSTVFNLIRGVRERLFTVGRLDKDTEGLLLLTNDGEFANRLMHPSYKIEKTYRVQLDRKLLPRHAEMLEKGIMLDGKRTAPCRINLLSGNQVSISIHEGRKRQIKKMLAAAGYRTISLKRIKYGSLKLGRLKAGEFRYLNNLEVKELLQQ